MMQIAANLSPQSFGFSESDQIVVNENNQICGIRITARNNDRTLYR